MPPVLFRMFVGAGFKPALPGPCCVAPPPFVPFVDNSPSLRGPTPGPLDGPPPLAVQPLSPLVFHGGNERLVRLPQTLDVDGLSQNPTPRPARYPAPSAVVSLTADRTTGIPSRSDWNCISNRLSVAPPSTRSEESGAPVSWLIASRMSRVW